MFVDTITYNFEDSLSRIDKMMGVVMTEQKPSVEIPFLEDLPEDRGVCCYSTVMAIRLETEKSPIAERMKETRAFLVGGIRNFGFSRPLHGHHHTWQLYDGCF